MHYCGRQHDIYFEYIGNALSPFMDTVLFAWKQIQIIASLARLQAALCMLQIHTLNQYLTSLGTCYWNSA